MRQRQGMIPLIAAVWLLLFAAFALPEKPKPEPCAPGRFLLPVGSQLIVGGPAVAIDAVVFQQKSVGIDSGCALTAGKVKPTKKGTRVAGKWKACGDLRKVRFRALISPGCNTMTGTIRARKFKRSFLAVRAASSLCGNGVLDQGEPCDTAISSASCPPDQGCIVETDRCACVPGCDVKNPSDAAFTAAVQSAIGAAEDPWRTPENFARFARDVEMQLGCSLQSPVVTGAAVVVSAFATCGVTYDDSVEYCGQGNSCVTSNWFKTYNPGTCINQACFDHDRCYDLNCVDVANECYFTKPQEAGCDAQLINACATCPELTTTILGTTVQTKQERVRDLVCAAVDYEVSAYPEAESVSPTGKRTVPAPCKNAACPGSTCVATSNGGMCAATTTTTTTISGCRDGRVDPSNNEQCEPRDVGFGLQRTECSEGQYCSLECRCVDVPSATTTTTLAGSCFTDGGETILDACTGLQWEKKTTTLGGPMNAADPHDVDNTYQWAGHCTAPAGNKLCQPTLAAETACKAQTLEIYRATGCEQCGEGERPCWVGPLATTAWGWVSELNRLNYAGYSDWRLPSEDGQRTSPPTDPRELETILLPFPCEAIPCIAPIFGPTSFLDYWSSSTWGPESAYFVGFFNGLVWPSDKRSLRHVRAVRGS